MSTQLFATTQSLFHSFRKFRESLSSLRTRRPARLSFRRRPRFDPEEHKLMFCDGLCTEATCLENLCKACVAEYFDWKLGKEK